MNPFYYSFYCETCKTETTHLIYFTEFTKGNARYIPVCCDCREKAENLGQIGFPLFYYEMSSNDWFSIIPFDNFCEIAN